MGRKGRNGKLRVGVIGLGVGRMHLEGFKGHAGTELAAIADPDAARLRETGDRFGIAARYASGEEMLEREKLDLVSIATPNKFHAPLAIAALKAGCHVLCEKPMAMNAREARGMIAAAKRAKRRLMINFSYRFNDQSHALKREVEAGTLGDIYFGRTVWHRRRGIPKFGGWFGQKALSGGGPLIDLGVHRLDLALWLMGSPKPAWVLAGTYDRIGGALARREGKKFDVEDLAAGMIRFENGAMLVVEASWAANIAEREMMETRLLGTKGGLVQRNLNEGYQFEAELFLERDGRQYDMKLRSGPRAPSAMAYFADCILEGKPHTATGEEGLVVMEILDAIYESARKGAPVRVSFPSPPSRGKG
jgi:predicted dehydrogenase